ncbi:MAG: BlaI/MecI/CopY family transcriptional regulator [Gemmatimonadaceae bacterium]
MSDYLLADRETDVMAVLWDRGSGTVAEVRESLRDTLAYTTVLTVLRTLEHKGIVAHVVTGQAHRYVPIVRRDAVRRSAIQRLLDKLFAGAPEQLLAHLVEEHSLNAADLARLRGQLDALQARADGGASHSTRGQKKRR